MRRLFEDEAVNRRFHRGQWRMIGLTIVGYTLFYCLRKNFSFAMPGLEQDLGVSKAMLGNCLMAGGLVYGVSKFVNGFIGDRVKARHLFCTGLAVCALVNVAFGFAPQIAALFSGGGADGVRALPSGGGAAVDVGTLAIVLGCLFVLNQFFQGTGFPPCAKLIAFWVPPKELATKMSVWNCSHSIGGGLVAKICGGIMALGVVGAANQGVGMWKWCFWTMAIAGALGVIVMWIFLPGTPEEEGLPPCPGTEVKSKSEEGKSADARSSIQTFKQSKNQTIFHAVFANPVIWLLGITNLTVNAARALVSDWGPTMLQEAKGLSSSQAGTELMLFEFAGIAGMLFGGWATDRLAGGRVPRVCVFMMATAVAALVGFWILPAGFAGTVALCLFGFSLYGPQALTGVAATNLCGKHLAGTSIGFISLFSYVGASLSGKVCGTLVQQTGGWFQPVAVIAVTVGVGTVVFLSLWCVRAHNYEQAG